MGKPWLFGIGKPKTGSNSLADALMLLGLKVHHTGRETKKGNRALHNQLVTNCEQHNEVLKFVDTDCDFIVDYPIHRLWKRLHQENPEARFILTYRPPDDVALSWVRMMLRKPKPLPERLPIDYKQFADECREHVSDVVKYFMDYGSNFLLLDTRDPSDVKWQLLCKFLGKKVPKKKYPHSFNHEVWEPKR